MSSLWLTLSSILNWSSNEHTFCSVKRDSLVISKTRPKEVRVNNYSFIVSIPERGTCVFFFLEIRNTSTGPLDCSLKNKVISERLAAKFYTDGGLRILMCCFNFLRKHWKCDTLCKTHARSQKCPILFSSSCCPQVTENFQIAVLETTLHFYPIEGLEDVISLHLFLWFKTDGMC